jgi:hypothetical protein
MRDEAGRASNTERMQMWCGHSARFARGDSGATITRDLWEHALRLLS